MSVCGRPTCQRGSFHVVPDECSDWPRFGYCAHSDGIPAIGKVPCLFTGGRTVDLGFCADHWPDPEPRPSGGEGMTAERTEP